ncbi:ubiquitin thioesterase OTU1-like isoform X1 [Temnothorax curvispinosus]|uniref:Ubiquitin thioesterase OTU n=1 Tax=Temnothorax curvispinosus TaxID=300111 RepID=A0A6J1PDX4_9HYME|nr:ubiquitin thioesterase OTU1-like isoform X1 [Temnothorax curvispinosus]XP_024883671.1 ubiquitin thioesterase OTU1-like isoform X1 [Temnothorax curvispinosus]
MASFVLRVKTKTGQKVVYGLTAHDKVSQLKAKLAELTGVPTAALQVLIGFPPKPIDLNAADATIERAGIISGDTLIVEEKQIVFNRHEQRLDNLGRSHIVDQDNFANAPGVLMRKVVPADNSCLFTSVGYVLNGKVDTSCASFMREIIANAVAADPNEYSEAFLGRPNVEYCEWILKSDAWGGAIELSILSKFYGLEIAVIDSINAIINRFGEDQHYAQRVFLIFDGIHYDPLYLEPLDGGSIQTIFPTEDERVLLEAAQLAKEARLSRQFTDVQKFTLMCIDCKVMLSGQAAAQQHAKDTGHKNFGEVAA